MNSSACSLTQDEVLQERAARLIKVMGLDSAIYVCRSNYWGGVLRFVLAYKKSLSQTQHNPIAA
ncbi:MAG: hypothetical protein AAGA73_08080 [Pseudomonadota bacterium]